MRSFSLPEFWNQFEVTEVYRVCLDYLQSFLSFSTCHLSFQHYKIFHSFLISVGEHLGHSPGPWRRSWMSSNADVSGGSCETSSHFMSQMRTSASGWVRSWSPRWCKAGDSSYLAMSHAVMQNRTMQELWRLWSGVPREVGRGPLDILVRPG